MPKLLQNVWQILTKKILKNLSKMLDKFFIMWYNIGTKNEGSKI